MSKKMTVSMKAVAEIVKLNGGLDVLEEDGIRIEHPHHPTFMPLCIEIEGTGPNDGPLISVAHYFERNGDLCPDPLIRFEVAEDGWESGEWDPVSMWTVLGGDQSTVGVGGRINEKLKQEIAEFATGWDKVIGSSFLSIARERASLGVPIGVPDDEDD